MNPITAAATAATATRMPMSGPFDLGLGSGGTPGYGCC